MSSAKCKVVCADNPKLIGTIVSLTVQSGKLTADIKLEVI